MIKYIQKGKQGRDSIECCFKPSGIYYLKISQKTAPYCDLEPGLNLICSLVIKIIFPPKVQSTAKKFC